MKTSMRTDLVIALVLASIFLFLALEAGIWNYRSALFPQAIGVGGLLAVGALVFVRVVLKQVPGQAPGNASVDDPPDFGSAEDPAGYRDHIRALRLLVWIGGVVGLSWLLGQMVAMSLFMLAFLRYESGFRWLTASCAGALTGAFLYVVFDRVLVVTWLDGALYRWVAGAL